MQRARTNAILAQLPSDEFLFLLPHLKLVSLQKGDILFEPGGSIGHYYFPVSSGIELAVDLADGSFGLTSFVSMGGIYPLHLIGQIPSHNRATVSSAGLCYRAPAWAVHEALRRHPHFLWLLLNEAVKLFEQASIESVCLRHHSLAQITAKLILLSLDNTQSSVLSLTHQEMANALGVRREGITMALREFKQRQYITTHRGGLTVQDRSGLERSACDCYQTLRGLRQAGQDISAGRKRLNDR